MNEKEPEETDAARTAELPSLDGFSLEGEDLLRVSRRIGDGVWKEYSVSFGELVRAVGSMLRAGGRP